MRLSLCFSCSLAPKDLWMYCTRHRRTPLSRWVCGCRGQLPLDIAELLLDLGCALGDQVLVAFIGIWLIRLVGQDFVLVLQRVGAFLQFRPVGRRKLRRVHFRSLGAAD